MILCSPPGSFSGLATTVFLQPRLFLIPYTETAAQFSFAVDLLKTRLQQGNGSLCTRWAQTRLSSLVPDFIAYRHAITQTTKAVLLTDGLPGLWRGTEATLVRCVEIVASAPGTRTW